MLAPVVSIRDLRRGDSVGYGRSWRARSNTRVAALAVGYADGFPRYLSGTASVRIGECLCPVVGRTSMDSIVIDLGQARGPRASLEQIAVGDTAVVFGQRNPVENLARASDTIGYELLCRRGSRVPLIYSE